jgi:hypothetical protein
MWACCDGFKARSAEAKSRGENDCIATMGLMIDKEEKDDVAAQ